MHGESRSDFSLVFSKFFPVEIIFASEEKSLAKTLLQAYLMVPFFPARCSWPSRLGPNLSRSKVICSLALI